MMTSPGNDYVPPKPVGEPFRADPSDPPPFARERAQGAVVQADAPMSWTSDTAAPNTLQSPPERPPSPAELRELAQKPQFQQPPRSTGRARMDPNERLAKLGLGAGIASIVLSPIFGPIAIVLGSIALGRGQKRIGAWALASGIAGTLIGVVGVLLVVLGIIDPHELIRRLQNK
jgi:hypothetical protein